MAKRKPKKRRKLSAYNLHMSREMKKGRTFKQAVASWKGGRTRTRRVIRSRSVSRRRTRTMPRKKSNRRSFLSTATLMKFARLGALAAPAAAIAIDPSLSGTTKLKKGVLHYTGFHMDRGTWNFWEALKGWGPFIGVSLLTYGFSKLMGIIRRI